MPVTHTQEELDKMSLDQIRQLALKEAQEEAAKAEAAPMAQPEDAQEEPKAEDPKGQPRDEKGRFAKTEDGKDDKPAEEDEQYVYRRVIDLGDGAGPEVFEADSLEELVDKIADAKKHASLKIRAQEAELRDLRAKKQAEKTKEDQDSEYVLSQELQQKPKDVIKRLAREAFEEEQRQKQSEIERKQQVVKNFLTTHPDYDDEGEAGQRNGALMSKWMGGAITAESFEKAYQELKSSGLLRLKGEEAHSGTEQPKPKEERIVRPKAEDVTPPRTRKESGVSTHSRPAALPTSTGPSEDELYSMPMEKLRDLANKQLLQR